MSVLAQVMVLPQQVSCFINASCSSRYHFSQFQVCFYCNLLASPLIRDADATEALLKGYLKLPLQFVWYGVGYVEIY